MYTSCKLSSFAFFLTNLKQSIFKTRSKKRNKKLKKKQKKKKQPYPSGKTAQKENFLYPL